MQHVTVVKEETQELCKIVSVVRTTIFRKGNSSAAFYSNSHEK